MICCEKCDEWFHGRCIGITKKLAKDIADYYCDNCKKDDPNLRIIYTHNPAQQDEKYSISIKQEPLEERKIDKKVLEKSQTSAAVAKSKSKQGTSDQPKTNQSKKRVGQKAKSKNHIRKQCANPDCCFETRLDSKYCSDDCGYIFNKMRYEAYFIPKWRVLEKNHSQARLKKMKDLDQLERDKVDLEQLIKTLKLEKEELEQNIRIIKDQASRLCKENASSRDNDDEDADMDNDDVEEATSGDLSKTFCITCGHTLPSEKKAFKHWSTCHKKHEASYNFTADVLVNYSCKEDENPKLYCHHQDKKSKRYCMHIESACPQHSNWHSDKDEVCGCPLNIMQKLVPDGEYCLELKKDCTQHYHWDKFRLAQLNMQRVHAFTRLDTINERIRVASANLADTYGGVVGVMLHNTINHASEKDTQEDDLAYDQERVDVDITMD